MDRCHGDRLAQWSRDYGAPPIGLCSNDVIPRVADRDVTTAHVT